MTTIFEHVKNVLSVEEKFSKDGQLFKNRIVEAALKLDPELLSLLLNDEISKKEFFQTLEDYIIFDKIKFQKFISNKQFFADNYTSYKNKIGLTTDYEFLSDSNEVVLSWPYKDCVLEGGQQKEDQKRQEKFWNQTLAPDEIDRLFEPKVLSDWKRFDTEGEQPVGNITGNENLIIKGNNLIALHSLKIKYKGQVNLIYIDPPYNTGGDSFNYNDRFNHSTWLTFMKNRLEIAHEMLAANGSIIVQLDWNESHYCKILLDEIFGRENFRNEIIWCYHGPGSPKMKQLNRKHDNILWYSKSGNWTFNGEDVRMKSEVHAGGFNNEMSADVSQSYEAKGKIPEDWWESGGTKEEFLEEMGLLYEGYKKINDKDWWKIAVAARIRIDGQKRTGYLTEKPYKLMDRIIKAFSNEGDLVLDFFAGSGTTGFCCSNNNRRFILIEQLQETQKILYRRFIHIPHLYFELYSPYQDLMTQITDSDDNILEEVLLNINKQILKFNVDYETLIRELDSFKNLEPHYKRAALINLLDQNIFYLSLYEMNDSTYEISDEVKILNNTFYGIT